QSVDFERLRKMKVDLPDALRQRGPALVAQFDSGRLADRPARFVYGRLVRNTLAASDIDDVTSNSAVTLLASSFERVARTQDVLAFNESINFTRLETGSAIVSSDFLPGIYTVKMKSGVKPTDAALAVAAATQSDPKVGVAIGTDYVPYFAEPQGGSE